VPVQTTAISGSFVANMHPRQCVPAKGFEERFVCWDSCKRNAAAGDEQDCEHRGAILRAARRITTIMDNQRGLCLIVGFPVQWMHYMRSVVCFLVLCLASATAVAQLPKTAEEIKAIDERVTSWRTTCLGDWDAATHMTRAQWRTTCERVAAERRQFLLQDPASFTVGKSRQR